MRHIQCPEKGDPAELVDGTAGIITNTDDSLFIIGDGSWQVNINIGNETDGDQILGERLVKWYGGKWQEVS
jgi:hypothetical protein